MIMTKTRKLIPKPNKISKSIGKFLIVATIR